MGYGVLVWFGTILVIHDSRMKHSQIHPKIYCQRSKRFSHAKRNWQKCQYWHQRFSLHENKNFSYKMLPLLVLNPWISDSKFNTLLSELIWHVLLRRSLNFFTWATWFLGFDDLVRINMILCYNTQIYGTFVLIKGIFFSKCTDVCSLTSVSSYLRPMKTASMNGILADFNTIAMNSSKSSLFKKESKSALDLLHSSEATFQDIFCLLLRLFLS